MNVYIWKRVELLTGSYHPEGGLVVIASSLEGARALIPKRTRYEPFDPEDTTPFNTEPDEVIPTVESQEPRAFVFPDAGCCC